MNIKQLFLPLFGALALIGCNKEAVEPTSSNDTETQPVRLALTMEATADASEMRAVSFDANQNVPPTTHDQYSDWTTHCFLRNADGSKKAYAVINWDATLEGGKVKLKMRGHELQLLPIGSSSAELSPENKPVAGERWSIVGITGGGKLNEERTRVDFAPDAELDKDLQPHQARVPFTFEKAYFTVSAASGERAPQISVHFKPQGSLLNIYANNKTAQTVQSELKVITNALSNNGYYDYSTGEAKWVFTHPDVQGETISRPISVANGTGKHYLLWGMPRTASSTGFNSKLDLAGYDISVEGEETKRPDDRKSGFDNALAYSVGFDIDRVWSPLNAILPLTTGGEHNTFVIPSKNGGFVDPSTITDEAKAIEAKIYYLYDEAVANFTGDHYLVYKGKKYGLPTVEEIATIFPSSERESNGDLTNPDVTSHYKTTETVVRTVREKVHFLGDETARLVTSTYKGDGNNILYALRFQDLEQRTAVRYEMFGSHLVITSRSLAGQPMPEIGTIATTGYWDTNNEKDVKITFPALGLMYRTRPQGPVERFLIDYGAYWSSTHRRGREAFCFSFDDRQKDIQGAGYNTTNTLLPLILFPKN